MASFPSSFTGTLKVLWWEGARDKSLHGIARLYLDPQRAEEDLRLARTLSRGETVWFLEDVTVAAAEELAVAEEPAGAKELVAAKDAPVRQGNPLFPARLLA